MVLIRDIISHRDVVQSVQLPGVDLEAHHLDLSIQLVAMVLLVVELVVVVVADVDEKVGVAGGGVGVVVEDHLCLEAMYNLSHP